MRLTAPELAAAYREGMMAEGATVLDAGQVGTEMLYFLVGSRELDGGLMCTASHNPKAYTGAKLVGRGALALSGDSGIGDVRDRIADGLGDAPGGGSVEEVDIYEEFQAAALGFIDSDSIRPLKVVVDGGNGMAGPMVGPLLERLGLDLVKAYWTPDGEFPRPRAQSDAAREPGVHHGRGRRAREPISGSRGTATPTAASSSMSTGAFVDGDFLTALMTASMLQKEPGATVLYDVRAVAGGGRHRRGRRGTGPGQPRRARFLQGPDAGRGGRLRRRGLRPLLLPRLLLR